MAPTTLSLVFTTVDAPLGLIMLAAVAFFTILFLVYLAYLQATVLLDARRHSRELEASRSLADQAEALAALGAAPGFLGCGRIQTLAGGGNTIQRGTAAQLSRVDASCAPRSSRAATGSPHPSVNWKTASIA